MLDGVVSRGSVLLEGGFEVSTLVAGIGWVIAVIDAVGFSIVLRRLDSIIILCK